MALCLFICLFIQLVFYAVLKNFLLMRQRSALVLEKIRQYHGGNQIRSTGWWKAFQRAAGEDARISWAWTHRLVGGLLGPGAAPWRLKPGIRNKSCFTYPLVQCMSQIPHNSDSFIFDLTKPISIVVSDINLYQAAYKEFQKTCSSCHSTCGESPHA